jgi:hypothetical protein
MAQLLRLETVGSVGAGLATGLTMGFVGGSIVVVIVGAIRFWRQQTAMVKGMGYAGGYDMVVIWVVSVAVSASARYL